MVRTNEQGDKKYIQNWESILPVKILNKPVDRNNCNHVVQEIETGNIQEVSHKVVSDNNPHIEPEDYSAIAVIPGIPCINKDVNAALYLQGVMD